MEPKQKPKKSTQPKAAPMLEPRTLADFVTTALATYRAASSHQHRVAQVSALIVELAIDDHNYDDAQLLAWVEQLPRPDFGYRTSTLALIAVYRARSGMVESARRFLNLAEGDIPTEAYDRNVAIQPLCAAWWRMNQAERADQEFASTAAAALADEAHLEYTLPGLVNVAALGGRFDKAADLLPRLLPNASSFMDTIPGVIALLEDGSGGGGDDDNRLLEMWIARPSTFGRTEFITRLVDSFLRRKRPQGFLELVLRRPDRFDDYDCVGAIQRTLKELERLVPVDAVSVAERLLAVSVLPKRAKPYVAAACGGAQIDSDAVTSAVAANDRETAINALKRFVDDPAFSLDDHRDALVYLDLLGERTHVDESLRSKRDELLARKPADRRPEALALTASLLGRHDLAREAVTMATKARRAQIAGAVVRGSVCAEDWAHAIAAVAQSGEPDSALSGIEMALSERWPARLWGPRAVLPRAIA